MSERNLSSTGKERSILYIALRTLLHYLVENYISGSMQFITSREEVMVEEANGKGTNAKLKKVKLP